MAEGPMTYQAAVARFGTTSATGAAKTPTGGITLAKPAVSPTQPPRVETPGDWRVPGVTGVPSEGLPLPTGTFPFSPASVQAYRTMGLMPPLYFNPSTPEEWLSFRVPDTSVEVDFYSLAESYYTKAAQSASNIETQNAFMMQYNDWRSSSVSFAWRLMSPPGTSYNAITLARAQAEQATQLSQMASDRDKNLFFSSAMAWLGNYSASAIPYASAYSADDIYNHLVSSASGSQSLTTDEQTALRNAISQAMARRTGVDDKSDIDMWEALGGDEAAKAIAEGIGEDELVSPTAREQLADKLTLAGVHQLTIEEMAKSFLPPTDIPDVVLSEEGYNEMLDTMGFADDEEYLNAQALAIIDELDKNRANLADFQAGLSDMAKFDAKDFALNFWVSPGATLLEGSQYYFKWVSQPLAGHAYRFINPELQEEYERQRASGSNFWVAASSAWDEWDCNWFLKHMVLENLTDPLTYVGWGIITKMLGRVPVIGSKLANINRGIASVMEYPFDAIKYGWSKLPKSQGQIAARAKSDAVQAIDVAMSQLYGYRSMKHITYAEWNKARDQLIKYALDNPNAQDVGARAGRALLSHSEISPSNIKSLYKSLGAKVTDEAITPAIHSDVNNVLETFIFRTEDLGPSQAGARLLKAMGLDPANPDLVAKASRFVTRYNDGVIRGAKLIKATDRIATHVATLKVGDRVLKDTTARLQSNAAKAAVEKGRFATLLHGIELRTQAVWRDYIDRYIVKPFAEAYLTFGMYGPMNTLEDYMRSALGGVKPRRMSIEPWEVLAVGLETDTNLQRYGISELMGYIKRAGPKAEHNNLVLQLAFMGNKKWSSMTYDILVRSFGAMGMDVRRNFVAGKFTQILAETGGDTFATLVRMVPDLTPRITAGLGKKAAKSFLDDINRAITTAYPEAVRSVKGMYTATKMKRADVMNVLNNYPDMPQEARTFILQEFESGRLLTDHNSVNAVMQDALNILRKDFVTSPEEATANFKQIADVLKELALDNPEELAKAVTSVSIMANAQAVLPSQVLGHANLMSRGLSPKLRSESFDDAYMRIMGFLDESNATVSGVIERIRTSLPKMKGLNVTQRQRISRIIDINETKLLANQEFRAENIALRQRLFEDTPANMRNNEWWQDTYTMLDNHFTEWKAADVALDAELQKLVVESDRAIYSSGIPRQNIKVTKGHLLSPSDISIIVGAREDDVSRGILSVLAVNDKDYFVNYVMARVIDGDVGVTRIRVGKVYDQILAGLQTKPETMSYITRCEKQLDGARRELLDLQLAHEYPEDLVAEMGKYVDDIADKLDKAAYETPKVDYLGGAKEIKPQLESVLDDLPGSVRSSVRQIRAGKIAKVSDMPVGGQASSRGELQLNVDMPLETFQSTLESTVYHEAFHLHNLDRVAAGDTDFIRSFLRLFDLKDKADDILKLTGEDRIIAFLNRYRAKLEKVSEMFTDRMLGKSIPKKYGNWIDEVIRVGDTRVLKPEFANYQSTRQAAMDESLKWYYKEFTDYTNANAFDAFMKSIFPYWTYESQRLFYVPRMFVRHPGIFMAYERYQDNTEHGYIHIPGTSMDINPFRGTVLGTLTTRLSRQDYPEYYDSIGAAGGFIEATDFISRYGFYPNVMFSIPLALGGGLEAQMGETLPSIHRSILNAMVAIDPNNQLVQTLTRTIFNDRFRDYSALIEANKMGADGVLLWTKVASGVELTEDEQATWTEAQRRAATYGVMFEQFGIFRLRTDEQYEIYEASSKLIEEWTGITPDQQEAIRRQGKNIWDIVGGLSRTQVAVLQSLDYFKWVSAKNPLLPSRKQLILNKQTLFWDDIENHNEALTARKLQAEQEFRTGVTGPDAYIAILNDIYDDQRDYMANLKESNMYKGVPITIEERNQYYLDTNEPLPVRHPFDELLDLYFSVELKEVIDPNTGEKYRDWDKFWSERNAIELAIPERYKQEFEDYISRNVTPYERVRKQVNETYFRPYNNAWDAVLKTRSEQEQSLINEYLSLERTEQNRPRQAEIQNMIGSDGKKLISSFRSDVTSVHQALRYANPRLDAWLNFWGRVHTFLTPEAEALYNQIQKDMGRAG